VTTKKQILTHEISFLLVRSSGTSIRLHLSFSLKTHQNIVSTSEWVSMHFAWMRTNW